MKIKRNKKSYKWFLCGLILVVVLTISYRVSKANYRISNSIELTTGKVVSSPYDFNIVSIYIDGVEQEKDILIPTNSGYVINEEQSYCYKESKSNKDNNARLYTDELGNHVFSGISKGSKCILYFEKADANKPATMQELLDKYYIYKKVRTSKNKDFNVPFEEITQNTVYVAPDGDNFSYYFAGNPLDNWVEFGGYYWRIIRINGDGSIRMIYQGRAYDENENRLEPQATGEGAIGAYSFNNSQDNYKYVGYWYGENNELRGLSNPSNAYTELNNWFASSNIRQGTNYFNLIDPNAGFCGDRTPYADIDGNVYIVDIGDKAIFYGALVRLVSEGSTSPVTPTLSCADNNDLYTYTGAKPKAGNHKLGSPVGMITADEAAYAGMVFSNTPSNNYLNIGLDYWTMSPYYWGLAFVFRVNSNGSIGYHYVTTANGIRPVINLRSDVEFTGSGTISDPYKVITS